jgi:hypothetical protein
LIGVFLTYSTILDGNNEETLGEYQNLFKIESYENKYGKISTSKALKGFSGKWKLEIRVNTDIVQLDS